MRFLVILMLVLSQVCLAEHRGGNGGDPLDVSLKSRLVKIARYVQANPSLFPAIWEIPWEKVAQGISLEVTNRKLHDRMKNRKCALNFHDQQRIIVNRKCMLDKKLSLQSLNALLAHELFNLRRIELPGVHGLSQYQYSEQFLDIEEHLIQAVGINQIISFDCSLRLDRSIELSKISGGLLSLKGYVKSESKSAVFYMAKRSLGNKGIGLYQYINDDLIWSTNTETLDEALLEIPGCYGH